MPLCALCGHLSAPTRSELVASEGEVKGRERTTVYERVERVGKEVQDWCFWVASLAREEEGVGSGGTGRDVRPGWI